MQYIQNLPFILSSTIKRKMKMKKTLNLFIPATCSFCCFKLQQR